MVTEPVPLNRRNTGLLTEHGHWASQCHWTGETGLFIEHGHWASQGHWTGETQGYSQNMATEPVSATEQEKHRVIHRTWPLSQSGPLNRRNTGLLTEHGHEPVPLNRRNRVIHRTVPVPVRILARQYFLNCSTLCLPDLVWWCIFISQSVMGLLSSRSRSQ